MVDKLEINRENKFRAWNKTKKKMLNHIETIHFGVRSLVENKETSWDWYKDEYELMQDTGLKDKDNKRIFEGDIVKVGIEPFVQVFEIKLDNIEIKTHNLGNIIINTFVIYNRKTGYKEPLILERVNGLNAGKIVYEVIGNIYENPELLEE